MTTSIFVNFPTTDLERSKGFYTALGFSINPLFTDENAACVVLGDNLYFMVLTREFLGTFTDKQIIDTTTQAQMAISLTRESREDVDEIVTRALSAGATEPRAAQDYGFMYSRDLEDPDGNLIGFFYMEPAAAEQGPEAYLAEHGADASQASA